MYPGVDIIEISRFAEACNRHPRLITRLFTSRELEAADSNRMVTLAAKFAGKEAVLKALGSGLRGLSWHDIEILNNNLGEPLVYLSERANKIVKDRGGYTVRVSLSHSRDNAVAVAFLC